MFPFGITTQGRDQQCRSRYTDTLADDDPQALGIVLIQLNLTSGSSLSAPLLPIFTAIESGFDHPNVSSMQPARPSEVGALLHIKAALESLPASASPRGTWKMALGVSTPELGCG